MIDVAALEPAALEPAALHGRLRERLHARPLVVLLDVDGTLAPIAPTPDAAQVPEGTRAAIARLARTPAVHVSLVSGRGAREALRLVGVNGIWAIGNHGFERIAPEGAMHTDPALAPWRERIAAAAGDAAPIVAAQEGALLENKTWTLSIHYRQAPAAAEAAIRAALERIVPEHGLVLTAGKKVFEVRPPVPVDKGTASLALVEHLTPAGGGAVLYAGDDRTDEDAFRALRRAFPGRAITVRIAPETGEAPTASTAEFVLSGVAAMGAFLELLAA